MRNYEKASHYTNCANGRNPANKFAATPGKDRLRGLVANGRAKRQSAKADFASCCCGFNRQHELSGYQVYYAQHSYRLPFTDYRLRT